MTTTIKKEAHAIANQLIRSGVPPFEARQRSVVIARNRLKLIKLSNQSNTESTEGTLVQTNMGF